MRKAVLIIGALALVIMLVVLVDHKQPCPSFAHFVQGGIALSKAECAPKSQ